MRIEAVLSHDCSPVFMVRPAPNKLKQPQIYRTPWIPVTLGRLCDTANAMEGDWWRRVRRVWQLGGPAALHAMTARVVMRPEAPSGAIDLCSTRARVSPLLQLLLLRTVSRATVVVAGPGPGPDLMAFNSAARLAASAVDATASRRSLASQPPMSS